MTDRPSAGPDASVPGGQPHDKGGMTMALCPYCHDETGGGETCNSCGAVLSVEAAAQLPMRWHKFMIHVVLWVFSAVLLLCAVILWVNRFTLRILPKTSMLASLVL